MINSLCNYVLQTIIPSLSSPSLFVDKLRKEVGTGAASVVKQSDYFLAVPVARSMSQCIFYTTLNPGRSLRQYTVKEKAAIKGFEVFFALFVGAIAESVHPVAILLDCITSIGLQSLGASEACSESLGTGVNVAVFALAQLDGTEDTVYVVAIPIFAGALSFGVSIGYKSIEKQCIKKGALKESFVVDASALYVTTVKKCLGVSLSRPEPIRQEAQNGVSGGRGERNGSKSITLNNRAFPAVPAAVTRFLKQVENAPLKKPGSTGQVVIARLLKKIYNNSCSLHINATKVSPAKIKYAHRAMGELRNSVMGLLEHWQ